MRNNLCESDDDEDLMCCKTYPCFDARQREGICIHYQQCPNINNIFEAYKSDKSSVSADDLLLIRRSKCGLYKSEMKYCCANEDLAFHELSLTTTKRSRIRSTTDIPSREINVHQDMKSSLFSMSTAAEFSTTEMPYEQFLEKFKLILPKSCGTAPLVDKIYGGDETELKEHPWIVSILFEETNTNLCGGSIITERFVLTAAHCYKKFPIDNKHMIPTHVRIGEWNFAGSPDCKLHEVTRDTICNPKEMNIKINRWIKHPEYIPKSKNNHHDIALIRLSKNIDFNKNSNSALAEPICLPLDPELKNFNEGTKLEAVGWGSMEMGIHSSIKLKVKLPLIDDNKCEEIFGNHSKVIIDSQLCAGGEKGT